jgi:hypothetical protein
MVSLRFQMGYKKVIKMKEACNKTFADASFIKLVLETSILK